MEENTSEHEGLLATTLSTDGEVKIIMNGNVTNVYLTINHFNKEEKTDE